jgi:predicted phosphodiesterase
LGDAEIPDHDADTFELAADVAERERIRTLVIAGDFVALDSFSTWKKSTGTVYNFANELAPAIESLKVFIKIFDTVVYITGNHERRISRQTDGNIILGYFLEGLDVKFSEYAYCILDSAGERFLVCHPDNYSSQPCTVPRGLAVTNNMHVIAGHTHRQSFCLAPNGIHYAIETGHCRDVLRTQYKALRTNLHPEWQNGFVVVIDGVPLLVNKHNHHFIRRPNGRAA